MIACCRQSLTTNADGARDITQWGFWGRRRRRLVFRARRGGAESIDQEIEISVVHLEQLSYQSGSGADTLWVHANDGTY
jgi:hypothetical protein